MENSKVSTIAGYQCVDAPSEQDTGPSICFACIYIQIYLIILQYMSSCFGLQIERIALTLLSFNVPNAPVAPLVDDSNLSNIPWIERDIRMRSSSSPSYWDCKKRVCLNTGSRMPCGNTSRGSSRNGK